MHESERKITTSYSSFEDMRKEGRLYVDKTAALYKLVTGSDMYFLSRPRRFGKTLTLSTLEAIFQGKRALFKGLAIDRMDYDWKRYPIVHIDFGSCSEKTAEDLDTWLCEKLSAIARKYGIILRGRKKSDVRFTQLLERLSDQGKIVVLIDEYDKVLSDNALADNVLDLRDTLKSFYEVIKTESKLLRFVLITGVTKFSKVGVFSGMNSLYDASSDPDYGTLMGYTQKELETCFASYIEQGVKDIGITREAYLAQIKEMYDGYRFALDSETVYNPVSVGLFFTRGHGRYFDDYWIETGSMKLVMDMASTVDLDVSNVLSRGMAKRAFDSFDVAELKHMKGNANLVQALLLQTGYLTIDHDDETKGLLFLRMPNREVEDAYYGSLLERICGGEETDQDVGDMCDALKAGETKRFMDIFIPFMSGISYPDGKAKESDFAGMVAVLMRVMRRQVRAISEDRTSRGRIDLSITTDKHIYVVEYKVDKSADVAMRQIKENHYADKFRLEKGKTIHLLAIAFSSTGHNVQDWKEELFA